MLLWGDEGTVVRYLPHNGQLRTLDTRLEQTVCVGGAPRSVRRRTQSSTPTMAITPTPAGSDALDHSVAAQVTAEFGE